jgi:hypothetical protein
LNVLIFAYHQPSNHLIFISAVINFGILFIPTLHPEIENNPYHFAFVKTSIGKLCNMDVFSPLHKIASGWDL